MDIALTVALFFGIGFVLDRWLGTTPLFMIALTVLAVGRLLRQLQVPLRRPRMEQLEAERAERAAAGRSAVSTAVSDRASSVHDPLDGPATEVHVSRDMIKRGLIVAPVLIAVCAVIWGGDGAWSAAYGIALVLANFALAAAIIATTARISLGLLMAATLFGYLIRLGLIFLAVCLVKDASWISLPALGATIIVTHLGLLFWEMKYVAISLAHPVSSPPARHRRHTHRRRTGTDHNVFGLEFPPINEILRWKDLFPTFNKVALIAVVAALIGIVIFLLAAGNRTARKAPRGVRNLAEIIVEFIEDQIVMPTMGREGLQWTPFLISLFVFIYLCNAPGIIPIIYMPATARIAIPLCLSLLVWVIFIGVGLKHQGLGYFGHLLWPPGVPTGAEAARRHHRVRLDDPHPPVLPHRPTDGQHDGRAHPARDVLRCCPRRCSRPRRTRSSSSRWASCRSACCCS